MCLLVYFILILFARSECARILAVFPVPSISHQVVFRPITQELARRGHEVVVVTPNPAFPEGAAPHNLIEIDVHNISYSAWKKESADISFTNPYLVIELIFNFFKKVFEVQITDSKLEKILRDKDQHFDLLLTEACVPHALHLSEIFKAPVIQVSSAGGIYGNNESVGAPVHPVLYPIRFRFKIFNLTFWEQISELYTHYKMGKIVTAAQKQPVMLWQHYYGLDLPSTDELKKNIHMLLLNVHALWDSYRPVPPGFVYMGGLHQVPKKDLPKELKEHLDSSTNGVIYVSLGTNVRPSSLPLERINMLLRVLSQVPCNVLLKWDTEEFPAVAENIRVSTWYPQSDLLSHPNVKLFITQGGLQSTDEAISAGVPLIAFPQMADQWYNSEKYVYHKIGKKLDFLTFSEKELLDAIYAIIGDKSYKENIRKLQSLILDQRERPLERAMWWIEYVIRHRGAAHLRPLSADISWSEWLQLDVIAILLLILIALLLTSLSLVYVLSKYTYCLIQMYIQKRKMKLKLKVNRDIN